MKISIIGMGYVGLPLALSFSKHFEVIGFDISETRISELNNGIDRTNESSSQELAGISVFFTTDENYLHNSDIFIVTVPTPINLNNQPNLDPLVGACQTIGRSLKKNNIVIFESTVYPGCTEEVCVPILENISSLKFNDDFYVGYSPERINPGDKLRKLEDIIKITSGSTPEAAEKVNLLYEKIISAGTFKAASIKTAEAAKVIENTQRDLNIALINELSIIFTKLGIDTQSVLQAASTKWNFLQFWPGLVGGHCISVDPYYLTYRSQMAGYDPLVILAGRRVNNNMGVYVANQLVKLMVKKAIQINRSKVLIMGVTFKENCPDIRNTRVIDIIDELKQFDIHIDIMDPMANNNELFLEHRLNLTVSPKENYYDAIIIAVAHNDFKLMGSKTIRSFGKSKSVIYDLKYLLNKNESDLRL